MSLLAKQHLVTYRILDRLEGGAKGAEAEEVVVEVEVVVAKKLEETAVLYSEVVVAE
jgi:hypothetical protein